MDEKVEIKAQSQVVVAGGNGCVLIQTPGDENYIAITAEAAEQVGRALIAISGLVRATGAPLSSVAVPQPMAYVQ